MNKPTDIITVPLSELRVAGQRPGDQLEGVHDVGSLYLAPDYIRRHCEAHAIVDLQSYMARLVAHGLLHTLGHDHIDDADFRRMYAEEVRLLDELRRRDATFNDAGFRLSLDDIVDDDDDELNDAREQKRALNTIEAS